MYKRKSGVFYARDRKTGQRLSLATADLAEAKRLLAAKNQAPDGDQTDGIPGDTNFAVVYDQPIFKIWND